MSNIIKLKKYQTKNFDYLDLITTLATNLVFIKMDIGENIRKVRDLKGFSQQALAESIGLSQKQLSRIETNQVSPTFDTLEKICEALGITLKNLLQFNEDLVFNNVVETQNGGEFIAYNNTDIKQIENLYKQLLAEKDKIISMLEARASQ